MNRTNVTEVEVGDTLFLDRRDGTTEGRTVEKVQVLSVSTAITVEIPSNGSFKGSAQYVYENWQSVQVEKKS